MPLPTEPLERALASVGLPVEAPAAPAPGAPPADLAWARCGAMALTGAADGPPRLAPAPLATAAATALRALARLSDSAPLAALDGAALLGEHAAAFGLSRRGRISAGGSCRLLPSVDGWLAVNLPRADDWRALPAWLDAATDSDWNDVAARVAERPAAELLERAWLLGLPVAEAREPCGADVPWCRCEALGEARPRPPQARPLVLDLSAVWAGPLCTHLLEQAGARVVKLECPARPDGARAAPAGFYDLLNAGKPSVALDLACEAGRAVLRRLLEAADVVVESARPRALAQLGIEAEAWVRARPGLTWLSLTGYGRRGRAASRVAFGDDAAAAAGLARATGAPGPPIFCGDAIADPLAGLHAAAAAWASFGLGGGHLIGVALRDAVAHWLAAEVPLRESRLRDGPRGWEVECRGVREPVRPPRLRRSPRRARPLGADTHALLAELGISC